MAGAAVSFTFSLPVRGTKNLVPTRLAKFNRNFISLRANAANSAPEETAVSYDSPNSVFPGEACDLVGGEACNVQMFSETKLAADHNKITSKSTKEEVERDYLEYDEPKTVFPGEACDNLGGEFCEPPYQEGVSQEVSAM